MASKSEDHHMLKDVITEILLRLPVKSLLRFECVCKYWNTFIRSSTFVKKHLHHQSNKARLLVHHYSYSTPTYALALCPDETLASFPLAYHDIQMPCEARDIIGYYDGILGLWEWGDRMALWNPATREVRPLPMPNPNIPPNFSAMQYIVGFGLDPTTNDYKVVMIRKFWDSEGSCPYDSEVIVIYYLSTNSWRLFEADLSLYFWVHDSSCSTCLNGIYYWLTSDRDYNNTYYYRVLLTFDLSNEVFGEIPGPREIPKSNLGNLILYNDSISVICFDPHKVEQYCDIWVMMEEGCWTKDLSIGPLVDVGRPLGFWKNGELFLETSTSELVLYDPNTQETKDLRHRGPYDILNIFMYKESLVSIKGGNNEWWERR